MYKIIIALLFVATIFNSCQGIKLKHKQQNTNNIDDSAPGQLSQDKQTWTGYLPQCGNQCQRANGIICGKMTKSCCKPGKCTQKFTFGYCQQKLQSFQCNLNDHAYQFKDIFPQQAYPSENQYVNKLFNGNNE